MYKVTFVKTITGIVGGEIYLGLDATLPFVPTCHIDYSMMGVYIPSEICVCVRWVHREGKFNVKIKDDDSVQGLERNGEVVNNLIRQHLGDGWRVISGWKDKKD